MHEMQEGMDVIGYRKQPAWHELQFILISIWAHGSGAAVENVILRATPAS